MITALDDYVKSMLFSTCNRPRRLLYAADEVNGVVLAPEEPEPDAGDDGGIIDLASDDEDGGGNDGGGDDEDGGGNDGGGHEGVV